MRVPKPSLLLASNISSWYCSTFLTNKLVKGLSNKLSYNSSKRWSIVRTMSIIAISKYEGCKFKLCKEFITSYIIISRSMLQDSFERAYWKSLEGSLQYFSFAFSATAVFCALVVLKVVSNGCLFAWSMLLSNFSRHVPDILMAKRLISLLFLPESWC